MRAEGLTDERSRPETGRREAPDVDADGIGVRFMLGSRREDLQSLTYAALLRRRRGEAFWALRDVTLRASAGDIVGIVGPNGAGKSVLCRVLGGMLQPDRGRLTVVGRTSALLALGTGFDAQLSGRENILMNGLVLGLSKRDVTALMDPIIRFSGLDNFIDQPLKHYSTGMKARLGFTIGAMLEPDILILDETLSGGDIEFATRAGERLQALITKARLVIVVSHSLPFVERYCTQALWLDRGAVQAAGRPVDVLAEYRRSIRPAIATTAPALLRRTAMPVSARAAIVADQVGVRFPARPTTVRAQPDGTPWRRLDRPQWALKDVSFRVDEGEIVGLIGLNGAGKSTLCKVLTGIIRPDAGSASVAGEITALLTIGAGFNDQLTGRDNTYLNGMLLGMARRRVRALYPGIVSFAGLERFMNEPVKHYSSGMRSRLGFSVATAIEPDILIIDEALNAGDVAFYEKAAARIQELIARAKAVIVVTHNLPFVDAVCTRLLWLDAGTLRFDGAPAEGLAAYRAAHAPAAPRRPAGG